MEAAAANKRRHCLGKHHRTETVDQTTLDSTMIRFELMVTANDPKSLKSQESKEDQKRFTHIRSEAGKTECQLEEPDESDEKERSGIQTSSTCRGHGLLSQWVYCFRRCVYLCKPALHDVARELAAATSRAFTLSIFNLCTFLPRLT